MWIRTVDAVLSLSDNALLGHDDCDTVAVIMRSQSNLKLHRACQITLSSTGQALCIDDAVEFRHR
jgi:hypothetical protein